MKGLWWLDEIYWCADMHQVNFNHLGFIEKQRGAETINFRGLDIHTYDGVYHPFPGSSTHVLADGLIKCAQPGMDVLEIGVGSGALALSLIHFGCRVVGADIDELAINCAKNNAETLNLTRCSEFYQSDMFNSVPNKKYDLIVFNPPLLHSEPVASKIGLHKRFDDIAIDHQGYLLKRFATESKQFLKEGGRVVALISNIGNYDAIKRFSEDMQLIGDTSCLHAQYRSSGNQWRFVISAVNQLN